jgi:hypothetical protein
MGWSRWNSIVVSIDASILFTLHTNKKALCDISNPGERGRMSYIRQVGSSSQSIASGYVRYRISGAMFPGMVPPLFKQQRLIRCSAGRAHGGSKTPVWFNLTTVDRLEFAARSNSQPLTLRKTYNIHSDTSLDFVFEDD